MSFGEDLKARLETATGNPAYVLEKPVEKSVPCSVFRIIGDYPFFALNGEHIQINRARVQLTSIADNYANLSTLVSDTEASLFGNGDGNNIIATFPLETKIEDKEDNLYYSIREYYVWYRYV